MRFPAAVGYPARFVSHFGRGGRDGDDEGARRAARPEGRTKMTFTDAAAEVLRLIGRPLHYKEITDIAIEKNLLSHVGKSPEVTMGARLAATLKKDTADNPLVRVKPGVFALREWDEKTIKSALDGKKAKRGAKPEAAKARKDEEQATLFDAGADDDAAEEASLALPRSSRRGAERSSESEPQTRRRRPRLRSTMRTRTTRTSWPARRARPG